VLKARRTSLAPARPSSSDCAGRWPVRARPRRRSRSPPRRWPEGVCRALDIAVAAVNADERRVYINPRFPWTEAGKPAVDDEVAGDVPQIGVAPLAPRLVAQADMQQFVRHAALAAGFEIVEDEGVCRALDIAVAAVNADERRVSQATFHR
jgi:hypothetical protein